MGIDVSLTAEQEAFARSCVASGRYASLSEVIGSALHSLERQEAARAAFERSLEEAVEEGERDGFVAIEDLEAEMRSVIASARAHQG